MKALFAATIALSAFLLFLVQPIIARQILPWFGGSAAVWTTCMVFFQLALLAGYLYSDLAARRVPPRRQATLHVALLVASLACLPIVADVAFKPQDAEAPIARILLLLAATIGLPYVMLATTGPLVQAWFARRFRGAHVYRLYALSNIASMLALLAYPPLIEPLAGTQAQAVGWSAGYALFVLLALASTWAALRGPRMAPADAHAGEAGGAGTPASAGAGIPAAAGTGADAAAAASYTAAAGAAPRHPDDAPSAPRRHATWFALAALGTALLLSVTTHIGQNVASVPFLWLLPLSLYLLTFILCFDGAGWYRRSWMLPLGMLLLTAMVAALQWRIDWTTLRPQRGLLPLWEALPLYTAGLFVLCMICHGELVARKPGHRQLTAFYLMVSAGGAAGGLCVGIAAPLLLSWYWEFPAALLLVAAMAALLSRGALRWVAVAALCAGVAGLTDHVHGIRADTIELTRNFYGAMRVKASGPANDPNAVLRLMHGVINHGEQYRVEAHRRRPTTYYGEASGIGRAIAATRAPDDATPQRIGLVGLGVGTLASYGRTGDTVRIYELDPQVDRLARTRFDFLRDSAATIETRLGDARLVLEGEAPAGFDVLAIDAFSGDSIPVHLITREAMRTYRRHVKERGVIAFHISNRYLDLSAVVRGLADEIGWHALRVIHDPGRGSPLYRSDWVLVSADPGFAERLKAGGPAEEIAARADLRPWTDDYNNLFQVLK